MVKIEHVQLFFFSMIIPSQPVF